jgi:two-component system, chemotaxis family, protein-glutamate methylesterase/glutaminase
MILSRSTPTPVVGIGASAGGVEALTGFFGALPRDVSASFLVVLHIPAHSPSQLDRVLGRVTSLPVCAARDGERIRPGHIYIAVPDRHLMLDGERIRLTRGPKECRVRPSIDVLLRSLAVTCGSHAAAVVLSGMLDDGTAGAWSIKERRGGVFAQDPTEAMHASMPQSVADHVATDAVAPVAALAAALAGWCASASVVAEQAMEPAAGRHSTENRIAAEANALQNGVMQLGRQSKYTCPDCHGVLVEIQEGRVVRYRCHTGHAFSMQTLLAEVDTAIDNGLWDTLRAIEERLLLLQQMAGKAAAEGDHDKAKQYQGLARDLEKPIAGLRRMVLDGRLLGHKSED